MGAQREPICPRCHAPKPDGRGVCLPCRRAYARAKRATARGRPLRPRSSLILQLPLELRLKVTAAAEACDLRLGQWIEEAIEAQLVICRHGKDDSPDEADPRLGTCGECGERFVRSQQYRVFCPTHTKGRHRPKETAAC